LIIFAEDALPLMKNAVPVLFLVLSLTSCGLSSPTKRERVEALLCDRPDSALALLNSAPRALMSGSSKAKISLLKAEAIDNLHLDTSDVSIINPAVDYYRKKGTPGERVLSLFYLGRMQMRAEDYDRAIVTFSEAVPYVGDVEDCRLAGRFYSAVSEVYRKTFDYQEAIRFAQLEYDKTSRPGGDSSSRLVALYDLARAYAAVDSVSVSDSLYSVLLSCCSEELPEDFISDVSCDFAVSKINRTPPDAKGALDLFGRVLSLSGELKEPYHLGAYAYTLALNGDYGASEEVLDSLKEKGEYYYWNSLVEESRGDYEKAYKSQKRALVYKDALVSETLGQSVSKAQRDFYVSLQKKEKEKSGTLTLWLVIIVLGSAFVLTLTFILYRRRLDETEREKAFLIASSEEIESQLGEKLQDAHKEVEEERANLRKAYTEMYKKQFDDFKAVGEVVLGVETASGGEQRIDYKALYEKMKGALGAISSDEAGRLRFEQTINDRMNGIMSRFRRDFPTLKDEDYYLAGCFFAGFKTSVIELLFKHLSAAAIYTRRYRLRRTIEASNAADKQQYLDLLS